MADETNKRPLLLYPPNSKFLIRPVKLADTEMLHELLWKQYTIEQIRDRIRRIERATNKQRGLGIMAIDGENGHPMGYGQLLLWKRCAEISDLMVRQDKRNLGIGTALIQHLVQAALAINTSCIEIGATAQNSRALALYQRVGFEQAYTMNLDVGNGAETINYLRLHLPDDTPADT